MKPRMGFYSDVRELAYPGAVLNQVKKKKQKNLTFKVFPVKV